MDGELHLNEGAYGILDSLSVPVVEYDCIRLLDLGIEQPLRRNTARGIGLRVAEASMGGLGTVGIDGGTLTVKIDEHPAISTLGCQLAGWSIDGGLGSGPARIPASKPKIFAEKLKYSEKSERVALVLETDNLPSEEVCGEILAKTGGNELIIAAFKGDSEIGIMNVLSRVVEMAFFRLDYLEFDTLRIRKAEGSVIIPESPDTFDCNDAIRYNGRVSIETSGWNESLTEKCVSSHSELYDRTFREIFEEAGNFYDINPDVFSPAELDVLDTDTGKGYHAGKRVHW